MHSLNSLSDLNKQLIFTIFALLVSALAIFSILKLDVSGPALLIFIPGLVVYLIFLFKNPRLGLLTTVIYAFLSGFISQLVGGIPSVSLEILLVITWIASLFAYGPNDWKAIKNDLCVWMLIWFCISFLQVINPGSSIQGWMAEMRSIALYPLLIVPIGFMLIKTNRNMNFLIVLFFILALIACLNGIRQLHFGLTESEQAFLDGGGASTHLLWGKLRVFSFYDAAQFGSSQAQFTLIAFILAFGNFKLWKRIALLIIGCLFFYGMLISGTRGVIIVLITGAFTAIALSKNIKTLVIGTLFMIVFLGGLKFTSIGSGNYEIYRLRTALNPQDESLNVRFSSQEMFGEYLKSRPFGGGLGVTGHFGHKFNRDKYLSTIEPDSFWVKVWAMYGIVGFVIWFCMYMYILGKGCGIVWTIKNDKLRVKLIALLSGATGVFFCSYGNEIMNIMPSLLVFCLSLVVVYQGPKMDLDLELELGREI